MFDTYAHLITTGPEAELPVDEAQQVYRYDFHTGQLVRVSIGEPSFPASKNGNTPGMNARIPALPGGSHAGTYGAHADINDWDRAISEDGSTIIFSTPERLQASDSNTGGDPSCESTPGETGCDVYEWHEGVVSMISDGQSAESADIAGGAAGMSASGSDIFFFTRTPLAGQDRDQLMDIYDARIDGGFPAPASEASCSGEACQGAASAPPALGGIGTSSLAAGGNLTPGSTAFAQPGEAERPKPSTNVQKLRKALKACAKYKRKARRGPCEKAAHRRYGPRSHRKAKRH
ncbi:MAG: hypothetical protein ACRDK7_13810 [Solirubrobacteraceae bacterium]